MGEPAAQHPRKAYPLLRHMLGGQSALGMEVGNIKTCKVWPVWPFRASAYVAEGMSSSSTAPRSMRADPPTLVELGACSWTVQGPPATQGAPQAHQGQQDARPCHGSDGTRESSEQAQIESTPCPSAADMTQSSHTCGLFRSIKGCTGATSNPGGTSGTPVAAEWGSDAC